MGKNSPDARKIALGGVLGALAVICLFLATVLPTNRLSFYALSSFFVAVMVMEWGIKAGWLFYAATSLVAIVVIPEKLEAVPYFLFFGIYGILKYYIEKINKQVFEYVLKFAYFNLCLLAAWFLIRQIFALSINIQLPWWGIIAVLEVVFFLYDFVYTLFIGYYRNKLKPMLKI